jgi:hypothetical protein
MTMTDTIEKLTEVARRHVEMEEDGNLDGILSTLESTAVYEFYPMAKRFTGLENLRAYYEHFVNDFRKRIRGYKVYSESVGENGLAQEYTIDVQHDEDDHPTRHRIAAVLAFGEKGLSGERLYSDEKLFRAMLGSLWDELEPVSYDQ